MVGPQRVALNKMQYIELAAWVSVEILGVGQLLVYCIIAC